MAVELSGQLTANEHIHPTRHHLQVFKASDSPPVLGDS